MPFTVLRLSMSIVLQDRRKFQEILLSLVACLKNMFCLLSDYCGFGMKVLGCKLEAYDILIINYATYTWDSIVLWSGEPLGLALSLSLSSLSLSLAS